jgi:hypothetical protein
MVCVCVCVCARVMVCVCARVCICSSQTRARAHIHTHIHTYTGTQAHTHTPTAIIATAIIAITVRVSDRVVGSLFFRRRTRFATTASAAFACAALAGFASAVLTVFLTSATRTVTALIATHHLPTTAAHFRVSLQTASYLNVGDAAFARCLLFLGCWLLQCPSERQCLVAITPTRRLARPPANEVEVAQWPGPQERVSLPLNHSLQGTRNIQVRRRLTVARASNLPGWCHPGQWRSFQRC